MAAPRWRSASAPGKFCPDVAAVAAGAFDFHCSSLLPGLTLSAHQSRCGICKLEFLRCARLFFLRNSKHRIERNTRQRLLSARACQGVRPDRQGQSQDLPKPWASAEKNQAAPQSLSLSHIFTHSLTLSLYSLLSFALHCRSLHSFSLFTLPLSFSLYSLFSSNETARKPARRMARSAPPWGSLHTRSACAVCASPESL